MLFLIFEKYSLKLSASIFGSLCVGRLFWVFFLGRILLIVVQICFGLFLCSSISFLKTSSFADFTRFFTLFLSFL